MVIADSLERAKSENDSEVSVAEKRSHLFLNTAIEGDRVLFLFVEAEAVRGERVKRTGYRGSP